MINLKQKGSVGEHIEKKAFRLEVKIECKIMVTRKPTTDISKYGTVATP